MTSPAAVAAAVQQRLAELERRYRRHGRSLSDLGSPEELAARMVAAVPEPSPWDQLVGPVYTTGKVTALLGVSRQAVAERRSRRSILALETSDGAVVYPAFQFHQGALLPGLPKLLRRFPLETVDGWTLAAWLVAPQPGLEGRSVVEWLREGGDPGPVEALAAEQAARYSR